MRRGAAAGATLIATLLGVLAWAPAAAQSIAPRPVLLVRVGGWSLDDLLGLPVTGALARSGGAALMVDPGDIGTEVETDDPDAIVREFLAETDAEEVAIAVVGVVAPSSTDRLLPVVFAIGPPGTLLADDGPQRALTSDSTRRSGIVVADDVLRSLGLGDGGADLRIAAASAEVPIDLHRRFLERSGSVGPIGASAGIAVTLVGVLGLIVLGRRGAAARRAARALAWAALAVPGLALSMLLAGHLPSLTVVPVTVTVLAVTAGVTASALGAGTATAARRVGAFVLAAIVVEAMTGWGGQVLPFLGASMLDGGRYFGLSNAFIGLVIGPAVLVAWGMRRLRGTALVVGAALIAGLPELGSNLGAGITGAAAAATWWAIGGGGRPSRRDLAVGAAIGSVTVVMVIAAHAVAPTPTHVQAALEGGGLVGRYLDRVGIGLRMLREHPVTIIPALGAPAMLWAALRPPSVWRRGFDAAPGSDAVVVTCAIAGVVAYLANDSGAAAAGLCSGFALVTAMWTSLRAASGKMSP